MVSGPEHYREAERLLENLRPNWEARDTMVAQVHATLALAAATALGGSAKMAHAEYQAWHAAAATEPQAVTRGGA